MLDVSDVLTAVLMPCPHLSPKALCSAKDQKSMLFSGNQGQRDCYYLPSGLGKAQVPPQVSQDPSGCVGLFSIVVLLRRFLKINVYNFLLKVSLNFYPTA